MKPENKFGNAAAFIAAILSFDAAAMEKREFASPEAFVKAIPNAIHGPAARGDLNADGRDDWAGFVKQVNPAHPERITIRQLHVLTQTAAGSYLLGVQSVPEELPERGTSENGFAEDMQIQNGMLSFKDRNLWRHCSTSVIFKFRFYKNDWRLVGATYTETNNEKDFGRSRSVDVNFLTGVELLSLDDRVTGRYKHAPEKLLLKDFNTYGEQFARIGKVRSVC